MKTIVILAVLGLPVLLTVLLTVRAVRRRRDFFTRRRRMDPRDWGNDYFPEYDESQMKIAYEVAEVFAASIGCHPTQILPSDSERQLSLSLAAFISRDDEWETWGDAIGRIAQRCLCIADTASPGLHPDAWKTFGDVVKDVLERVRIEPRQAHDSIPRIG